MHRRVFPASRWLASLALVLVMAGCGASDDIGSWTVTYRANLTGIGTIDSVVYTGSNNITTRVATPNVNFVVTQTNGPGPSLQVVLYGNATTGGNAKLAMLWMSPDGTLAGDSATVTAPATPGTKFTITVGPRQL